MKNLFFVRIPSLCICFTLITIGNVLLNLLSGYDTSPFLLVLFLWLAVCQLIDQLISKINFRKWSHYCLTESALLYVLSLLFFRLVLWDGFSLSSFIAFTITFLLTDICVFWYFHKRQEIQAEEINALINEMKK